MGSAGTDRVQPRLAFPPEEYAKRLGRARAALAQRGLGSAVCIAPETLYYLTGYDAYTYFSEQALVLPARPDLEPVLLVRDVDEPLARESCNVADVRIYHYGADSAAELAAAIVREVDPGSGQVGIEVQSYAVPAAYGQRLTSAFAGRELADVTNALGELRIQKSELEIQEVRRAAHITNLALNAAYDAIRAGVTEIAVAAEMQYALGRNGSEYSAMPVSIGSGPRTAGGHATPTDRVIEHGDPVAFYFAGVHKRYHVSAYKTVHVGPPSKRFRQLYDAAEETLGVLSGSVKAGRPVREAAFAAAENLGRHGLAEHAKMRWGYGVGVAFPPAWLEPLDIIEESDSVFAPGMVMCLHVCLFLPEERLGLLVGGDYLLLEGSLEALDRSGPGLRVL